MYRDEHSNDSGDSFAIRPVTLLMVATVTSGMLLGGSLARATDIPVIPKKLIVVDKLTAAGKAKLVYVSKDQDAGITKGTGTDVGQISIQFDVVYGNGNAAGAFTLPVGESNGTAGWLVNKDTVAKYVNKTAPSGTTEAKVGVIKPDKLLKLVGKGLGDVPLDIFAAGDPGAGGVQTAYCVTNAGEEFCHCSAFTGCAYKLIAGDTGAKLVCKSGTGDALCGAVTPPTTTSTSTSSTTTTSTSTSTTSTTVACVATSGCFCDTGLTVIDTCNDLEWEKKDTAVGSGVDAGNLNDVDNPYTWAGACTIGGALCQPNGAAAATCAAQTGGAAGCGECGVGEGTCDVDPSGFPADTTIWDWLNQLNAAGFAGHSDWRLPTSAGCCGVPTSEPAELESLLDVTQGSCGGGSGACIAPILGPTLTAGPYYAASVHASDPILAWSVWYANISPMVNSFGKRFTFPVRAVRVP